MLPSDRSLRHLPWWWPPFLYVPPLLIAFVALWWWLGWIAPVACTVTWFAFAAWFSRKRPRSAPKGYRSPSARAIATRRARR